MRRVLCELASGKTLVQRSLSSEQTKNRSLSSMMSLDELQFVNRAIYKLPVDEVEENYVRTVPNACFSKLSPTPVKNPKLVAVSGPALKLVDIDVDYEKANSDEHFVNCFVGNEKISGSETYSHCYCGHQFGVFAGQLGDGAAIYLGEVKNSKGEFWELQLKGAGKTPYSRDADGRKVLRSSVREFLCSEAMFHLGIPTTRAGTCIVSDDTVVRDQFYDGRNKLERCTVVLRIAESFLRFGSFEIFKPIDQESQRVGPSFGRIDLLRNLADYCLTTLYPEIDGKTIEQPEKYKEFYKEVVLRTAKLVAKWQCVGWVHGVLNTDNMSILGLTLDYGPYGFMDCFDLDHVPNTSDTDGRYSYRKQPEICFWNLLKLAEALNPLVPLPELKDILRKEYFAAYNLEYTTIMNQKLGLQQRLENEETNSDGVQITSDMDLLQVLLTVMARVGSDFTNTFRALSKLDLPGSPTYESSREIILKELLSQSSTKAGMISKYENFMELPMVQMRMILLRNFAEQLKDDELSNRVIARLSHYEHLKEISEQQWKDEITEEWNDFLDVYSRRIEFDTRDLKSGEDRSRINVERKKSMDSINPRIILRNHLAEDAIKRAENDDFTGVRELLSALERPFSDDEDLQKFTNSPEPAEHYDFDERMADFLRFVHQHLEEQFGYSFLYYLPHFVDLKCLECNFQRNELLKIGIRDAENIQRKNKK